MANIQRYVHQSTSVMRKVETIAALAHEHYDGDMQYAASEARRALAATSCALNAAVSGPEQETMVNAFTAYLSGIEQSLDAAARQYAKAIARVGRR